MNKQKMLTRISEMENNGFHFVELIILLREMVLKLPDDSESFKPFEAQENQPGTKAIADRLEYFVNNPSAWTSFDQGVSDLIEMAVKALRAK